jgi:DNA-binding transcriptional regulator YdaS (Cro superfamily)
VALAETTAPSATPAAAAAPVKDTRPCVPGILASAPAPANGRSVVVDSQLAARLGVSTARLEQALRQVKLELRQAGIMPTQQRFDALLAHLLGISQATVRQAFPAVTATPKGIQVSVSGPVGSKGPTTACAKPPRGKVTAPPPQQGEEAIAAAVARDLNLSTAQVEAALQPVFAAGHADPSSPAFAAAAAQLGVSVQQLAGALTQGKQSLAPAS